LKTQVSFENQDLLVIETRKDSAVHVSLSSSSLVKQPGVQNPTSISGRSSKVLLDGKSQPMTTGCHFTHLSEELTGAETSQGQRPRRRRAQWPVYKPAFGSLSTPDVNKSSHRVEESSGTGSPEFQQHRAV
jgi:hypothetical protein